MTRALALAGALALLMVTGSQGQSALLFNTSFDCPDWVQNSGADPCGPGDWIKPHGGWTAAGKLDTITLAANNPLGTGKGFRHYRGVGVNTTGGGLNIGGFPGLTKFWMRVYMRFSQGFAWTNNQMQYTKDLYWNVGVSDYRITGFSGGNFYFHVMGTQSYKSTAHWNTIMGSVVGDGKFHCYEQYIKVGAGTGELKQWVDGAQVYDGVNLQMGSTTLRYFALGENQSNVAVAGYTDYDDLALSLNGQIGCLSGQPPPAPPSNLRIVG